MNIVIIDDERTFETSPDDNVTYLRTEQEALAYFAKWWTQFLSGGYDCQIDELWFDHDLGDGGEALSVAKFLWALSGTLEGLNMPIEAIFVHSQNPVGAERILDYCEAITLRARRVPLPTLVPSEAQRIRYICSGCKRPDNDHRFAPCDGAEWEAE